MATNGLPPGTKVPPRNPIGAGQAFIGLCNVRGVALQLFYYRVDTNLHGERYRVHRSYRNAYSETVVGSAGSAGILKHVGMYRAALREEGGHWFSRSN